MQEFSSVGSKAFGCFRVRVSGLRTLGREREGEREREREREREGGREGGREGEGGRESLNAWIDR